MILAQAEQPDFATMLAGLILEPGLAAFQPAGQMQDLGSKYGVLQAQLERCLSRA